MSQNINLFSPALRKPRQQLTLAVVVQCLGITLAALFAYNYYLQQQLSSAAAELVVARKFANCRSVAVFCAEVSGPERALASAPTAGAARAARTTWRNSERAIGLIK